jgi:hypothetical protein
VTENATKLAHVLDNVNPLHLPIMSTKSEPKGAQAQVCAIILCMPSCHGCSENFAESIFVGKQAISASEPLAPHNANGNIQGVVGVARAVADATTHSAMKPLGDVRFLRLRVM